MKRIDKVKNVIITGGSRGIGKEIAKHLLKGEYSVHICARDEDDLKNTASELSALGNIDYKILDISKRDSILEFCDSWNKPLYGIINNAGICKTEKLIETGNVWDDVIRTNLESVYFLTKGLVKFIKNEGRIINISSQLGKEGRVGYGAYCASKFGIIGLTKCWAKELGEQGITVNAVCPGWVKTEMAINDVKRMAEEKGISADDLYEEICQPLELKRFTEPSEVANLVAFLMSEDASGITGRDWLLNTVWNQE